MGSNKTLWTLISGINILASGEVVGMQLEEACERLLNGMKYYTGPSSESLNKLKQKKQVDENHMKFVTKLSKLLQLDELQAWELLCVFLMYEYRGTTETLRNHLQKDREVQALLVDIWYFYHSERLFLLKCLKHILTCCEDKDHPNQVYYSDFLGTYNKNGVLKGNIISQLAKVMDETSPTNDSHGPYLTDACIKSWTWFNLCEQVEILQIILIYLQNHPFTSKDFHVLLLLFRKHGFGIRHSFWQTVEHTDLLLQTVNHCQSLILVHMMNLTSLYQGLENKLWADEAIKKKVDDILLSLLIQQEHSLVALSWMMFQYLGKEDPSTLRHYKKLGEKAIHSRVLLYMIHILKNPMLQTNAVGNLAARIIHGVVDAVLSCFERSKLGSLEEMRVLICSLMRNDALAMETWRLGSEGGVGSFHVAAMENFPLDFMTLVELSTALADAGIHSCQKVMDLFQSLPCFKEDLDNVPGSILQSIHGNTIWQLLAAHHPFRSTAALTIPAGTKGHVTGWPQPVVQWNCTINGWDVIYCKIHTLLGQMQQHGAGSIKQEAILEIVAIANLVQKILQTNELALDSTKKMVDSLFILVERFSQVPNPPLILLASCLEVFAVVARVHPQSIWQRLAQIDMFPSMSCPPNELTQMFGDVYMRPGLVGNLRAGEESALRTYPLTKAFLRLLLNTIEAFEEKENPTLGSIVYVLREIFPLYHKWRYGDLGEQEQVGKLCLELFHCVLNTSSSGGSSKERRTNLVLGPCIYGLLYTEASQMLLKIVETGDILIRRSLEQQAALDFGRGTELMRVVQLALSVLNRLLLLRDRVQSSGVQSPLEAILSSQPQGPARPHFILTVASYIYHRFNPKLPTLAVKLLKRFAREFPMSLLACLGTEAEAIRDVFLSRLEGQTEDVFLKVSLLEFLAVCVEMQPGLIQMFINIPTGNNAKEIECRCLDSVTEILNEASQKGDEAAKALHCAAMQFVQALWLGRRILAVSYLKQAPVFWSSVCQLLFEDPRKNIRASSYIFNIITLELYTYRKEIDGELEKAVNKFCSDKNKYLTKWCEHVLCTLLEIKESSSMDSSFLLSSSESPSTMLLLTGWKNFLVVVAKTQGWRLGVSQQEKILHSVMQALQIQLQQGNSNEKIHVLLAELCAILLQEWRKSDSVSGLTLANLKELFLQAASLFQDLHPRAQAGILAIGIGALHSFKTALNKDPLSLDAFITSTIIIVKHCMLGAPKQLAAEKGSLKSPVLSVCFLHQLVLMEKHDELWLGVFKENDIVGILVNVASIGIQLNRGVELVHSILGLFVALASLPSTTEMLVQCKLNQFLCLPLATVKEELDFKSPNWTSVHMLCCWLYTQLLRVRRHFFLGEALDFAGVHGERMCRALARVRVDLRVHTLEAAVATVNFLDQLAGYQNEWRLQQGTSMPQLMHGVINTLYTCVSFLLRPSLLQVLVEQQVQQQAPMMDRATFELQRMRRLSSTEGEVEKASPQLVETQARLMDLLACCLSVLHHFSPCLSVLLTEGGLDLGQYELLLNTGFGTPTLDKQEVPCLTFGTLLAAVTVCVRILTKGESTLSPAEAPSSGLSHRRVLVVMTQSLVLLLSQALLYLLDPRLSPRDKQLVRRELGAELNSFTDTMRRYLQLGTRSPQHGAGANVLKLAASEQSFIKLMGNIVDRIFK